MFLARRANDVADCHTVSVRFAVVSLSFFRLDTVLFFWHERNLRCPFPIPTSFAGLLVCCLAARLRDVLLWMSFWPLNAFSVSERRCCSANGLFIPRYLRVSRELYRFWYPPSLAVVPRAGCAHPY